MRLANLRYLRQGRRWELQDPAAARALAEVGRAGMTLGEAMHDAGGGCAAGHLWLRAAMLALLWHQVWVVDLEVALSSRTEIQRVSTVQL